MVAIRMKNRIEFLDITIIQEKQINFREGMLVGIKNGEGTIFKKKKKKYTKT
jgi:hypothetical protein